MRGIGGSRAGMGRKKNRRYEDEGALRFSV
jgi:hypothetical protein